MSRDVSIPVADGGDEYEYQDNAPTAPASDGGDPDDRRASDSTDHSDADGAIVTPDERITIVDMTLTASGVLVLLALLIFLGMEIYNPTMWAVSDRTLTVLLGLIGALLGIDMMSSRRSRGGGR